MFQGKKTNEKKRIKKKIGFGYQSQCAAGPVTPVIKKKTKKYILVGQKKSITGKKMFRGKKTVARNQIKKKNNKGVSTVAGNQCSNPQ